MPQQTPDKSLSFTKPQFPLLLNGSHKKVPLSLPVQSEAQATRHGCRAQPALPRAARQAGPCPRVPPDRTFCPAAEEGQPLTSGFGKSGSFKVTQAPNFRGQEKELRAAPGAGEGQHFTGLLTSSRASL